MSQFIYGINSHNKLLTLQERIPLEFTGAEGDLGLSHDCGRFVDW